MPSWRKKNYKNSYSSFKHKGGGVLLDLSHELDYLQWIFPNLKFDYFFEKKISNLKIKSDDIAIINGSGKNKMKFQINLNYFSRIPRRLIMVDTDKFSFIGDLVNNVYSIAYDKKKISKKFKKYTQNYLTFLMYKSIFNKKLKNLCTMSSGIKTLSTIDLLRKNFTVQK